MCTGFRRWCDPRDKAAGYSLRPVLFGFPYVRVRGVERLTARCLGLEDGASLQAAMLKRNQLVWAVGGGQGAAPGRAGRPSGPASDRARISFAIEHQLHPIVLFGKSYKMQGVCQLMI